MIRLIQDSDHWDVACIHHAVVGAYKARMFDVDLAVTAAAMNHVDVVESLDSAGCRCAVLTRSVFEADRGVTDDASPIGGYAIAKTLTVDAWRNAFNSAGIEASTMTITNPIGPLEEPRFVNYLVSTWARGETPELRAPDRVRDNVPIGLLAELYADACEDAAGGTVVDRTPSLWVSSNYDFARRVAYEFSNRWGLDLSVAVSPDRDLSEPRIRVGLEAIDWFDPSDERRFWDEYADYYVGEMGLNGNPSLIKEPLL